ncbi:MAG: hypothetical protein U5K71_14420 [Gracilimonas sp.]|nr:hypothetical protein [Gracilimonas sp.]
MSSYSLNALYEVIGITKQGVWDHFRREQAELDLIRKVIGQVDKRRSEHPGEGSLISFSIMESFLDLFSTALIFYFVLYVSDYRRFKTK